MWECGWLATGVDFAQNDWPLISQLMSQHCTGQSALGGLCPLLGLAHNRHSANICSMTHTGNQRKGHQGGRWSPEGAGLERGHRNLEPLALYHGPCSEHLLGKHMVQVGRGGLKLGRFALIRGGDPHNHHHPIHYLAILLQLLVIDPS